ncbi:hypothetical protein Hypma_007814 [Hypsizygus marmoreus]|uniref:Uncharacterized protein n=1 Tax=Hypsizygus marmoreus TaxID=39966 RepID=A0A369JRZ3_HYPMA|nr:hypothetical protein Hypma_007814 [Hypsizygus marmoreus]
MRFHFLASCLFVCLIALFGGIPSVASLSVPRKRLSLPFAWTQSVTNASIPFDVWESAKAIGDKLRVYTDEQLHEYSQLISAATPKINEFKDTMATAVAATNDLRDFIERKADGGFSLERISRKSSLYPCQTPKMPVETAFVKILAVEGISERDARAKFGEIEPHVKNVLLVTGQLVDNHPILVKTLVFSGAALLIPEAWLLRPILALFGFGPSGPVKGSAAADAQRRFWGAAVAEGSWFSHLQRAGMKGIPGK